MTWVNEGKEFWETMTVEKFILCLKNNEKLDAQDGNGHVPLHLAAMWNKEPLLLEGMVFKKPLTVLATTLNDDTPLHYVAKYHTNPEAIIALYSGAPVFNAKNKMGETPFKIAMRNEAFLSTEIGRELVRQLGVSSGEIQE